MTIPANNPIVVGVDGSRSALHAVRWAAREAALRGAPLRLVHVCTLVPPGYPQQVALRTGHADVLLDQGRQWLWEAAGAARAVADTVEVGTDLRDGVATKVLIAESASARLTVLGSRGLGGFGELLVGSISVALAAHGHSPIVVIRGPGVDAEPPGAGPVVVGVDGSPASEAAIGFAFDAASARAVPLVAVHTWLDLDLAATWTPLPLAVGWDRVAADERRVLDERLAGWPAKYPDVELRRVVVRDRPVHALLEQAEGGQLIVVGSRGRGALTGLGLGSVSQSLLHHARCPVAVVRPEASRPEASRS